jgi:hexosaminidase
VSVTPGAVRLTGGDPAGLFHSTQTLLQLFPAAIFRRMPVAGIRWTLPGVEIEDAPRFGWRGLLLDVSRHFFGRAAILTLIDALALHRMNVLHLHLTDDQGWRVEITRYPRLTEAGSWRACSALDDPDVRPAGVAPVYDRSPHSGFLSQDDLREIVVYAAERFITVLPEIDLPGHSQAAIAAYPELGNGTVPLEVWTDWGVSPHVLNVSDETIEFYHGVLDEILDIFPGEFVHLGGDECPTDEWRDSPAAQERVTELGLPGEGALQAWLLAGFDRYLAERGRRLIGWDEILEGEIPTRASVMSWRGTAGGIAAAVAGHDVVMTPEEDTYLYRRQSDSPGEEPESVGPTLPLRQVFEYDPMPAGLPASARPRILGAQCQMWTEFVSSERQLHVMLFPRFCAFAEAVWSTERRPYDDFLSRMGVHRERLHGLGIDGFEERPARGATG